MDQNSSVGMATVAADGTWSYSGSVITNSVHLLKAVADLSGDGSASTINYYAPAAQPNNLYNLTTTAINTDSTGIHISTRLSTGVTSWVQTTNDYTSDGALIQQTIIDHYRSIFNDRTEVITAPNAFGVTTDSIQGTKTSFGGSDNIVKNYYDSSFHIIQQDTLTAAGILLKVLAAPDSNGHTLEYDYPDANSFTLTEYAGTTKLYTNHYADSWTILSQDRFDNTGHLTTSTTAPDANGRITSVDYDTAHNQIGSVVYDAEATQFNSFHHPGSKTESATFHFYTGDGIQPIDFSTASADLGDTFVFEHAYDTPTHEVVEGFDPNDRVVLKGFDASSPYTVHEDSTGIELLLSDHTALYFMGIQHASDLHILTF